ncbi:MAG: hypothetical protein OXN89_24860 [Bryobacterales bacterium]|nr:hypothetical protein [Bryobacterales bacterium]
MIAKTKIVPVLRCLEQAPETGFPTVAEGAMRKLQEKLGGPMRATATLLLTLARPARLVSVSSASVMALNDLAGVRRSRLCKPNDYRCLLD